MIAVARRHSRIKSYLRDAAGSIAVEAAILLPVLTLLFVGGVDFAGVMIARTELFNAIHAGMLYSMSYPNDLVGVQAAIQNASSTETGAGAINVTAANTCHCIGGSTIAGNCISANCTAGDDYQTLSLSATQNYQLMISFPGLPNSITLSENASVRTTNQ